MATITRYEDFPALVLSNDVLEVSVLQRGTSIVSIALRDDPARLNPLWNPQQVARDHGEPRSSVFPLSPGMGHFVCVDGFGPASAEEQQAGMPMHGEAHQQLYSIDQNSKCGDTHALKLTAELPLVHERFTRTLSLADGEQVLCVESELENLLAFDRPVVWAEHATVAAPFLEREATVVDMRAARSMTRPYSSPDDPPHRLKSAKEFDWPLAPALNGTLVDLRSAGIAASGDHTASLMDPSRQTAFITVLHPQRRMMLGYLFRHDHFPFVQNWEYYPANGHLARGLEFSTQPWDCPRHEAIEANSLFGAPTYRWLSANGKVTSRFLMFWTRTPEDFVSVADVRLENGSVVVSDSRAKAFTLKSSFSL